MSDPAHDPLPLEDPRFESLTGAAADGLDVDWDQAESKAAGPEERAVIQQLRILARLGHLFRASSDDESAPFQVPLTPEPSPLSTASVADPESPLDLSGWGPFDIRARVGHGTFGTVYRAWEPGLEREVAIKILHDVEPGAAMRLVDEARMLARIRHSNIVTIFGADRFEGLVGFWMEFINGRTLKQFQEEHGTCSAQEAIVFGLDLCRALAAVHRAGFLHCDVKAQNVMREAGGRIVLMDFGTAILMHGAKAGTLVGGTPLYLAPEVLEGAPPSVQSDIYSLGVLLYYLVSGDFPVTGASIQELSKAHASRKRRWLRDVRPDLPAPFVRAVDAATAVLPENRPDSAGDMEALLDGTSGRLSPLTRPSKRPAQDVQRQRSIAVLPFADMSPDRSLDYFCEGIAEEIINAFTNVPGVRVVARGSAFKFKSRIEDHRYVASVLNAETVLEGSVRTSGGRLRVIARLIDAADGAQLWSERFDRQLDDVFAVQDEIAQAAARALGVRVTSGAPDAAMPASMVGTRDLEAYTLCLKGRFCLNQRTEIALRRSAEYFDAAAAKDPQYAEAYAGLADAYLTMGTYGALAPDDSMPKAKAAAHRAVDLADTLTGPQVTLGCITAVYDWQWRAAEAYFRRAIDLNPNYPTAHHWYAINYLVPLQRFDEAIEALRRASAADPLSTPIRVSAGILSYFAHRFDDARRQLRETLDLESGSSIARLFLGLTLVETGQHDQAIRELDMARQLSASPEMTAAMGYARARAGDVEGAGRALSELHRLAGQRYVSRSLIAQVYAGLGETQAALESLQKASESRAADLAWLAVRPVFDGLRSHPVLSDLIAALGQGG